MQSSIICKACNAESPQWFFCVFFPNRCQCETHATIEVSKEKPSWGICCDISVIDKHISIFFHAQKLNECRMKRLPDRCLENKKNASGRMSWQSWHTPLDSPPKTQNWWIYQRANEVGRICALWPHGTISQCTIWDKRCRNTYYFTQVLLSNLMTVWKIMVLIFIICQNILVLCSECKTNASLPSTIASLKKQFKVAAFSQHNAWWTNYIPSGKHASGTLQLSAANVHTYDLKSRNFLGPSGHMGRCKVFDWLPRVAIFGTYGETCRASSER